MKRRRERKRSNITYNMYRSMYVSYICINNHVSYSCIIYQVSYSYMYQVSSIMYNMYHTQVSYSSIILMHVSSI